MQHDFRQRGFLPAEDPLTGLPPDSPYAMLDDVGAEVPVRLTDPGFRQWAAGLRIPDWSRRAGADAERLARLYYVRTGFLGSADVNQVEAPATHVLPANLARPLCQVAADLNRPPTLSYAGYALYNWHRLDSEGFKIPHEPNELTTLAHRISGN